MKPYIEFMKKSFINNMAFRSNYFFGLLNTIILIFVNISIWQALYGGQDEINGISFAMVVTNFVIGLSFSNALSVNDFMIASRVHNGQIAMDLLKPLNINLTMMFQTLGDNLFRIVAYFAPSLLFSMLFFKILPPVSIPILAFVIFSIFMGFFILYNISFIISVLSFWFVNIWSFSTIKNVFIGVLSGTMLPLWFMPEWVSNIIKFTPFGVIYFAPIQIYLGQVAGMDILYIFLNQLIWVIILFSIGQILWAKGMKKLLVVGG